jgi:hypothetical protein
MKVTRDIAEEPKVVPVIANAQMNDNVIPFRKRA